MKLKISQKKADSKSAFFCLTSTLCHKNPDTKLLESLFLKIQLYQNEFTVFNEKMKMMAQWPIQIFFLCFFFFGATLLFKKPVELKRSDYLPPPVAVKYLSVGLKYQLADSLWLRALQDFDYCDKKINQTECRGQSWLFQTLNLATEIDPVFEALMYRSAGLALTVIISDYAGASVIFDKAVQHYPDNWNVTYVAAYHALFEEKNKLKAARLYEMAAKHGAPTWVYAMAGRLAREGGESSYAKQILQGMIDANLDPKIIDRLKKKILRDK